MRNILFIVLVFYLSGLQAASEFLYIDSSQTKGLKNFQINELNKISLQMALATEKYQILFNKPTKNDRLKESKKFKFTYLTLKVSEKRDFLSLEYGLLDVASKKYIKKVRKEKVLPRKFLIESKSLLEQLFGKKKRKKRRLNKNNKPIIENNADNDKAPLTPPRDPNKSARAFQNNIENIKKDIDEAAEDLDDTPEKKEEKPRIKKEESQLADSKIIDSPDPNNPKSQITDTNNLLIKSSYLVGYKYQTLVITNNISGTDITTKSNFETVPLGAAFWLRPNRFSKEAFIFDFQIDRVLASDNYEVKTPYKLGGIFQINTNLLVNKFNLGFTYSSQSFISIKNESEGLDAHSIKDLSLLINLEKTFFESSFPIITSIGSSISLMASTDVISSEEETKLDMLRFFSKIETRIYENYYISFSYLNTTFDAEENFSGTIDSVLFAFNYKNY